MVSRSVYIGLPEDHPVDARFPVATEAVDDVLHAAAHRGLAQRPTDFRDDSALSLLRQSAT
jgi:hypothetical protein